MNDDTDAERILSLHIPETLNSNPGLIWGMIDQVIGVNVRVKAHRLWHQTQDDDTLSPTSITVRYAQIQALLDYADEVDPKNSHVTDWCLVHFGWKFPIDSKDVENDAH